MAERGVFCELLSGEISLLTGKFTGNLHDFASKWHSAAANILTPLENLAETDEILTRGVAQQRHTERMRAMQWATFVAAL
jgi:hypothetical protein